MVVLFKSKISAKQAFEEEKCNAIFKPKKVLGKWPDLQGGNWKQRWRELFSPKVMLGAGRKDGVSRSRELGSRYNYHGVSCSLMCDT